MSPHESWALPGWRCCATRGGAVGRVNAATLNGRLEGEPRASVLEVADTYAARELTPRLRLTTLSEPDVFAEARALGFVASAETLVMGRELGSARPHGSGSPADDAVAWRPEASSSWSAAHLAGHDQHEAEERLALAATARSPKAYFAARQQPGVGAVAIGLAVGGDGLLGIYDVLTLPEHRRGGHARRVVRAMLAWGAETGAEDAYLQVASGNAPAVSLYRSLGFEVVYAYRYLAPG